MKKDLQYLFPWLAQQLPSRPGMFRSEIIMSAFIFALLFCAVTLSSAHPNASVIPEMRWVLLPGGTSGTCASNTNSCANTYCYGLEYTPGTTGSLTSYTTAFFVDCVNGGSPVITNASCVMTNVSNVVNGCASFGLIQMQCSGQTGSLNVTSGVPVILHQVCFTIPSGTNINIIEDEVSDLTTSIDAPGNVFVTEFPEYDSQVIGHDNIVTNTNNSGTGSLRDVISCTASGGTIIFASTLNNQTISLTSGVISISKNLTIQGLGNNNLTISGNNSSVIYHVLPGFNLIVKDLALKNATSPTNGGAIYAQGNVKLQNVLFQNNFENGIPKSLTLSPASLLEIVGTVNLKN